MLHYYPFYWADYSSKTLHLTQGQHGAYMLLLRYIYTTGKPIPNSDKYRIAQAHLQAEIENCDYVLENFFQPSDGFWHNQPAERVIKEQNDLHKKKVEGGRKGGMARVQNTLSTPSSTPQTELQAKDQPSFKQSESKLNNISSSSDKSSEEDSEKGELQGVLVLPKFILKELWDGYLDMREGPTKKGKRKAPLTELAKKLTLKKLERFEEKQKGWANLALENAIQGGWQGVHEPDEKKKKQIHKNFKDQDYDAGCEGFIVD